VPLPVSVERSCVSVNQTACRDAFGLTLDDKKDLQARLVGATYESFRDSGWKTELVVVTATVVRALQEKFLRALREGVVGHPRDTIGAWSDARWQDLFALRQPRQLNAKGLETKANRTARRSLSLSAIGGLPESYRVSFDTRAVTMKPDVRTAASSALAQHKSLSTSPPGSTRSVLSSAASSASTHTPVSRTPSAVRVLIPDTAGIEPVSMGGMDPDALRYELDEMKRANGTLMNELGALRHELGEMKRANETLMNELGALRHELGEMKRAYRALMDELKETRCELAEVRRENAVLKRENTALKSRPVDSHADIDGALDAFPRLSLTEAGDA